jgi:ABC-type bacteriocin/lantibiotic exporter with double-glycine peptidase domain
MIAKLWKLVQPEARSRFLALFVLVCAGGFVELGGIATTAEMMGMVATKGKNLSGGPLTILMSLTGVSEPETQLKYGLAFTIAVLGLVHAYTMLRTYLRSQFVWIQDRETSTKIFENCLGQPYSWFLKKNTGELHRLVGSTHTTQSLINGFLSAVGQFSVAGTLSVALFIADPYVATIGVAVVTGAYALVKLYSQKTLKEKGGEAHKSETARRVTAQEALIGIRFVKTTAREDFFVKRYSKHAADASRGMVFHGIYVETVRAFLEWMTFAGILSLSVYFVLGAEDFDSLLPRLTLYTMAGYRIVPAIHELFGLWSRLKFDAEHLHKIEELLNAVPEVPLEGEPVQGLMTSELLVTMKDVDFRYEGAEADALKCIDLEIPRGKWIGVVGTTGAGKTTLLDVVSGLVKPSDGQLVVGESPMTVSVVKDWQSHIGVVPQEVILLDDTVARNVAFGVELEDIDMELVQKVCAMAGLAELLASVPEGLQTRLRERGTRLSGGERQRVGLARALYRKPSLLLLDEATSALDQATEKRIIQTLGELTSECTMITVAHRLSSVKPCDLILVMEDGEIIDRGTFDELLESSPTFQRLALYPATV